MLTLTRRRFVSSLLAASLGLVSAPALAAEKKDFKIAWSIYAGWMPWEYARESGILKKWADKYGIAIQLVQINDYIESINQYTAGQFDGCVMTNMDMLTIPAAGGVDSTAVVVNDFSNGNDGVVLKGKGKKVADLKGQKVNLVELSVSHYLLARALDSAKLRERDVKIVNTSDADIVAAYKTPEVTAVATWNPQLSEILSNPDATLVFNSRQIPGEIIDLTVVNSETLKANPKLGKALAGAWYETMAVMTKGDATAIAAKTSMAEAAGTNLASYEKQLKDTRMFYEAAEAAAFLKGADLPKTMDLVRTFSFDHALLGEGAKSPDVVGIQLPDGKVLGDKKNVKMRFSAEFTEQAAAGTL